MCRSSNRSVAMGEGAPLVATHSYVGAGTLPAWLAVAYAAAAASQVLPPTHLGRSRARSRHCLRRLIHAQPARATASAVPAPAHAAGAPPLLAPRFERDVCNRCPPLTPWLGTSREPDRNRPAQHQRASHPIAAEAEQAVIVLVICFQQRPPPGADDPVAHVHHPQPG